MANDWPEKLVTIRPPFCDKSGRKPAKKILEYWNQQSGFNFVTFICKVNLNF
jgi:hypothetical protein